MNMQYIQCDTESMIAVSPLRGRDTLVRAQHAVPLFDRLSDHASLVGRGRHLICMLPARIICLRNVFMTGIGPRDLRRCINRCGRLQGFTVRAGQ